MTNKENTQNVQLESVLISSKLYLLCNRQLYILLSTKRISIYLDTLMPAKFLSKLISFYATMIKSVEDRTINPRGFPVSETKSSVSWNLHHESTLNTNQNSYIYPYSNSYYMLIKFNKQVSSLSVVIPLDNSPLKVFSVISALHPSW